MNRKDTDKFIQALQKSLTETDWKAVESDNTHVISPQLLTLSPTRVEVEPSTSSKLFFAVFAYCPLIGFVPVTIALAEKFRQIIFEVQREASSGLTALLPEIILLIGLLGVLGFFSFIGFRMRSAHREKRSVFDKTLDRYWHGQPKLTSVAEISRQESHCKLTDIIALQVLDTVIKDSDGDTASVSQLNLLLKNRERINILACSEKETALAEAELLGDFLDIPVLTKEPTAVLGQSGRIEQAEQHDLEKNRHFRTPVIANLIGGLTILMAVGYTVYFIASDPEHDWFYSVKKIAFPIFVLCAVTLIALYVYNHILLSGFLKKHPRITTASAIEELKPLLRTNMYSALLMMFLQLVGAATGLITVFHAFSRQMPITGVTTVGLFVVLAVVLMRYEKTEESIKQIPGDSDYLEKKLRQLLNCWMYKALPDF